MTVDSTIGLSSRADVVVIGTGAGGSTVAHRLAVAGVKVLLVEQGEHLPTRRGPDDTIGRYISEAHPDRSVPIAFVGGQTKFYGSALYRFREIDFVETSHESGISPAWPIRYAELEKFYGEVEQIYRVHGNISADPTEPWRSTALPFAAIENSPIIAELTSRLSRANTRVTPIPRGLDWRGGHGACVLCATCDAYHCRLDAKMDAEVAAIRPALATGNLTLLTGAKCLKIIVTPDGRSIEGVLLELGGEQHTIAAGKVIVAAGLPGTAQLLRRSRTDAHPEGLGNAGSALGRYLAGHSTGMVFPFVSLRALEPEHTKSFAINDFYNNSPGWPYPTGAIQMSGQMPFSRDASRPIRPIAKFVANHTLTSFYMTEALPTQQTGYVFDGDNLGARVEPVQNLTTFRRLRQLTVDIFRSAGYHSLARRRPPYMWHEVGTARMGDDGATSVVDPNLQVHGVAGLHVVDASVLPTAGAVNTGLTIMALAQRLGEHIAA